MTDLPDISKLVTVNGKLRKRRYGSGPGNKMAKKYSPELTEEICRRFANGETLVSITSEPGMPSHQAIQRWKEIYPEFTEKYEAAQRVLAERLAENMRHKIDDTSRDFVEQNGKMVQNNAAVGRLRVELDWTKWRTEKLYPEKYGNKSEVHTTHDIHLETIDLNEAARIEAFLRAMSQKPGTNQELVVEYSSGKPQDAIESKGS